MVEFTERRPNGEWRPTARTSGNVGGRVPGLDVVVALDEEFVEALQKRVKFDSKSDIPGICWRCDAGLRGPRRISARKWDIDVAPCRRGTQACATTARCCGAPGSESGDLSDGL